MPALHGPLVDAKSPRDLGGNNPFSEQPQRPRRRRAPRATLAFERAARSVRIASAHAWRNEAGIPVKINRAAGKQEDAERQYRIGVRTEDICEQHL